jgi:guanylate kinase
MMETKNNSEDAVLKSLFKKDLLALAGIYPKEVLTLVENSMDVLLKDYLAWQKALIVIAKNLGVENDDVNEIPRLVEQITFDKVKDTLSKTKVKKIVLGIAGPGAVGKEAIKNALGFDMVVNTTTRPKRDYEKEAQHYHFVNDARFKDIVAQNGFAVSMERQGRGQYGVQKQDIEKVLSRSEVSIIEENPNNLASLSEYIKIHEGCEFVLVYILPPSPILPHLVARLAGRCQETSDDFRSAIVSTLNARQLDEFKSISNSIDKNINTVLVVNDSVERVVEKIKDLVEMK